MLNLFSQSGFRHVCVSCVSGIGTPTSLHHLANEVQLSTFACLFAFVIIFGCHIRITSTKNNKESIYY